MKKEMISAVEIYNKKFSNNDKYLKDILLEKAKELIIEQLNSPNLKITRDKDSLYTCIIVTIVRTPHYYIDDTEGIGDFTTWYKVYFCNESKFPKKELDNWLEQFGWEINIDQYFNKKEKVKFKVCLKSIEFSTNALNCKHLEKFLGYRPEF